MLSCNAAPCDEDGCINRGPGVSEVRYMRHDPENHGEGINFVSQGYFIMDIGAEDSVADLSAVDKDYVGHWLRNLLRNFRCCRDCKRSANCAADNYWLGRCNR